MAKVKTGLGRGLDNLIPNYLGTEAKTEEAKLTLKTSQIEPNKGQPRKKFDSESIEELAASIKQYGIIEPIVVVKSGDHYSIVAGERRWRAAKKAGLKEVPVVIKDYTEKEIAEISLIENIQREDLNPVEEAKAYQQLINDYNLTQEELAERISKSRSAITNTLRLLKLHPDVQKMLINGTLTAGHARALLAIEDQDTQLTLAEKVIKDSLSVRQTEDLVKSYGKDSTGVRIKMKNDPQYKELEKKLSSILGTKVSIKQKEKGKGRVEISYYSEEQLDDIFLILNRGK